jgi:hypothetical protein
MLEQRSCSEKILIILMIQLLEFPLGQYLSVTTSNHKTLFQLQEETKISNQPAFQIIFSLLQNKKSFGKKTIVRSDVDWLI